jgi:thiol-disulfide isomerase/thioredoxin
MLARVKEVGEPEFDPRRKREEGYLADYKRRQHVLYRKKAAILLELCHIHSDDPRVPEWMNRRWVLLGWNQDPKDVALEVIADIAAVTRTETDALVLRHAAYWRAYYKAHMLEGDAEAMLAAVDEFAAKYPDDERGAELLSLVVEDESAGREVRLAIYRRLATLYPDTHYGTYAPGMIRRIESKGKPFELSFEDAITGEHISIAKLQGKVVVIDFWATTCAPCVAAMPRLKELYRRFRDRGVAVIGVSLDENEANGGLKALRRFVKKHEIPWPQFYQGNGYESAFSKSWGVGSAPTMFVLDKKGRLYSTEAHGRLEEAVQAVLSE